MNSIPKSTELRAMAQLLNIDYSQTNFRSSTDRRNLYNRIQLVRSEALKDVESESNVAPVEPNEELEALRIENARLKQENQELTNRVKSLESKAEVTEETVRVLSNRLDEFMQTAYKDPRNTVTLADLKRIVKKQEETLVEQQKTIEELYGHSEYPEAS